MTGFLLSVHVLAAILTIGPVAVAASMFRPAARALLRDPADPRAESTVRILHRVTRIYAVIGIFVPVFGLATGASLGVLGDPWLIVSMVLTAGAAALLAGVVLPEQRRTLAAVGTGDAMERHGGLGRRLAISTGAFNLCWAVVVVLMIYRPGSTTGAGL